jgi:hypothetical protein
MLRLRRALADSSESALSVLRAFVSGLGVFSVPDAERIALATLSERDNGTREGREKQARRLLGRSLAIRALAEENI